MNKIDADSLLDDFESEARAHIEKIESAFLDIDSLAGSPALMDGVFRAAHSLKGTAGFFSLGKIVSVAHELESVFSRIKNGTLVLDDDIVDAALRSADCLRDLVDHIRTPDAVDTKDILTLLKSYAEVQAAGVSAGEARISFDLRNPMTEKILKSAEKRGHRAYYLDITFDRSLGRYYNHPEALVDDILSIGAIVEAMADGEAIDASASSELAAKVTDELTKRRVSALELLVTSVLEPELFQIAVELDGRFVHLLPREGAEKETGETPASPKGVSSSETSAPQPLQQKADFSIQINVEVVNGLMDLANEMILTRNQLLSFLSGYRKSVAGLAPVLHDMSRLTSEIQEKVMRARMQPIGVIFRKFPRIIRDMAKSLGKDIQIKVSGGDVALDKYLLDSLSDPLTQIVRNSADHGIESAERRAALGKPLKGVISLGARIRDGSAVIEVSDDGAGINAEALRQKALERRIASEERLAAMTGSALLALIFEPGFSTAEHVTSVSGRGVGMDIVKTNIEKLGGSVEIDSEPDRGTTLRLRVPLTLSVVRTLVVTIDSVQYAVPEVNVERIVRVSEGASAKRLERINSSLVLNLDGWVIPAVTMAEIDARAKGLEPPSAGALPTGNPRGAVSKYLVMRAGSLYFALSIDDAVKTEETLVKPLPIYLYHSRCYAGVTVLGSGKAIMILDAEGIMRLMGIAGARKAVSAEGDGAVKGDARRVIVFQCSGTEYFALDADGVARIERIASRDIQEIGDGQFVNASGKTARVVRPEDYVPVPKRAYEKDNLCLLMLGAGEMPTGFLAGRVIDQVEETFALDGGLFENQYVMGTGAYREKILIFLDAAEILRSLEADWSDKIKRRPEPIAEIVDL